MIPVGTTIINKKRSLAQFVLMFGVGWMAASSLSIDRFMAAQLFVMACAIGSIAYLCGLIVKGERKELIAMLESVGRS